MQLDIDYLLARWQQGDSTAFEQLFPIVYDELRSLASNILRKNPYQSLLQTTALVNEAFLRLQKLKSISLEKRNYFFALAAKVVRGIVVDYIRSENGRDIRRIKVTLNETLFTDFTNNIELLELDLALDKLSKVHSRGSKIVEMHFFGGMTFKEIADFLGCSISTVKNDWSFVRAWLLRELKG